MRKIRILAAACLSLSLLAGAAGCKSQTNPSIGTVQQTSTEAETESMTVSDAIQETTTEEETETETQTEEATTQEPSTSAPAETKPASDEASHDLAPGSIMYVSANQLNIREIPSTDGNIVGQLYLGEEVEIKEISGDGWVLMHSKTADGYVKSDFLSSTPTVQASQPAQQPAVSSASAASSTSANGHIVCIDAGHQQQGISEKEPNGPGSSVMKAKLTTGTQGCVTGLTEYQLNLDVSLKLKQELISRGYQVVMIRETNDCTMSNAERAVYANNSGAEIFVRIHANSLDDSSVHGAMFYAPSAANPYLSAELVSASNALSAAMLNAFCQTTGLENHGLLQDDGMTGINWCKIPVTIAEMGFMSNPDEDRKMADPAFQTLMAQGLANGIDAYFGI